MCVAAYVCVPRRCATQIAGIAAHCEQCGWDVCCDCATALRQNVEATAAASPTNVALQVTCCNPQCSKHTGSSAESEQSSCPVSIPMQQQQGGAAAGQRVGGVRMAAGAEEGGLEEEEEEGEQEEEPCVVRQGLFSLPGNAPLQLQLVLPPDLLDSLGELLKVSKVSTTLSMGCSSRCDKTLKPSTCQVACTVHVWVCSPLAVLWFWLEALSEKRLQPFHMLRGSAQAWYFFQCHRLCWCLMAFITKLCSCWGFDHMARLAWRSLQDRPSMTPSSSASAHVPCGMSFLLCVAVLQAQRGSHAQPLLQDCPLLSATDLRLLQSSPPTVPSSNQPLTLQQLQSPEWWQYMPGELRDSWRRSAAVPGFCSTAQQQQREDSQQQQQAEAASWVQQQLGNTHHSQQPMAASAAGGQPAKQQSTCSSVSGGFLFTPHVGQLEQEGPVGLLARLVFWARWRLGEPIIVQGVKVGGLSWLAAFL